jgi:hypothetical protein
LLLRPAIRRIELEQLLESPDGAFVVADLVGVDHA